MAKASASHVRAERRNELLAVAKLSLERLLDTLKQQVLEAAPMASVSTVRGLVISLGDGRLAVDSIQAAPPDSLARHGSLPAFDVIAYSAIAARKPRDRYDYEGRSHSLWFCDAHDEGVYRWYELAFMVQPLIPQRFTLDPFALPPTNADAAGALSPAITTRQMAWGPIPIDQGDEGPFIERWIGWFASAVSGALDHPSMMPEQSGGRWRFGRQMTAST